LNRESTAVGMCYLVVAVAAQNTSDRRTSFVSRENLLLRTQREYFSG
jgi:hypothetical protein